MHSRQGGLPSLESLAEVMQATRHLLTEQAGLSLNVHTLLSPYYCGFYKYQCIIFLWVIRATIHDILELRVDYVWPFGVTMLA